MSEETAPVGDAVSYAVPADAPAEMTVSDAARMLSQAKRQRLESPAESAPEAPAETESAVEADATPEQGTTAEDTEAEPEIPAIDPPRSWSKDAHERWAKLDRETQDYLVARDSEDQRAIKRALNEAADERKAVKAEREAAEQEKKGYQAKLPALMQALQDAADHQFPDIKSMADLERLTNEAQHLWQTDPFAAGPLMARLQAFQVHQQKLIAVNQELQRAESEKLSATQDELNAYKNEHDKLLLESAPELADPTKKAEVMDKAVKALVEDLGFKRSELEEFAANPVAAKLLFHNAFQKLVYGHLKFSDLKAAPAKAILKPVPPVSRPGTAKGGNPSVSLQIQNIQSKLSQATGKESLLLAAELTRLKRTAAR